GVEEEAGRVLFQRRGLADRRVRVVLPEDGDLVAPFADGLAEGAALDGGAVGIDGEEMGRIARHPGAIIGGPDISHAVLDVWMSAHTLPRVKRKSAVTTPRGVGSRYSACARGVGLGNGSAVLTYIKYIMQRSDLTSVL